LYTRVLLPAPAPNFKEAKQDQIEPNQKVNSMKKKKLNPLSIFGSDINSDVALSRNEMKKIMAGSGSDCHSSPDCPIYRPCLDCSSFPCKCSNCCVA